MTLWAYISGATEETCDGEKVGETRDGETVGEVGSCDELGELETCDGTCVVGEIVTGGTSKLPIGSTISRNGSCIKSLSDFEWKGNTFS